MQQFHIYLSIFFVLALLAEFDKGLPARDVVRM